MFHDDIMAKLLSDELNKMNEAEDDAHCEFDPGKFLKEKILSQIISIQALVFGNTT